MEVIPEAVEGEGGWRWASEVDLYGGKRHWRRLVISIGLSWLQRSPALNGIRIMVITDG